MSVQSANTSIIADKSFFAILTGLVFVVVAIAAMKFAGMSADNAQPLGEADEILVLRVEDAPEGTVVVRSAETGAEIKTFKRAEGSFVRAVLRALVNDRRRKGTEIKGDFRLERHAGGQLHLIDEVTGKRLTLNAYGPDNSAVFAAFMSNQQGEGQ